MGAVKLIVAKEDYDRAKELAKDY